MATPLCAAGKMCRSKGVRWTRRSSAYAAISRHRQSGSRQPYGPTLIQGSGVKPDSEFDRQPVLTGRLIELRPLRSEDFEAVFKAASDPLIWEQHPDRE